MPTPTRIIHKQRLIKWSVDVSIYLAYLSIEKALDKALYEQLLPIPRRQGFRFARAGITLPNEANGLQHELCGFRRVAWLPNVGQKFGVWRDVAWGSVDLSPAMERASKPTPCRSLQR